MKNLFEMTVSLLFIASSLLYKSFYILLLSPRRAVQKLHKWIIQSQSCDLFVTGCLPSQQGAYHLLAGYKPRVPVKVEGRNLCIVSFKVWEVEEVYISLCVSGLSVKQKHRETVKKKWRVRFSLQVCQFWCSVVLPHGFEQSLSVVWERCEQFELGAPRLLNWRTCRRFIINHKKHTPHTYVHSRNNYFTDYFNLSCCLWTLFGRSWICCIPTKLNHVVHASDKQWRQWGWAQIKARVWSLSSEQIQYESFRKRSCPGCRVPRLSEPRPVNKSKHINQSLSLFFYSWLQHLNIHL